MLEKEEQNIYYARGGDEEELWNWVREQAEHQEFLSAVVDDRLMFLAQVVEWIASYNY
jgi:hypothetical protein